ncbi:MAG: hypothetical protein AAFV29_23685, partial [Myxococcota bacterium]
ALLFEAVNATNPMRHTRAAERVLGQQARAGEDVTSPNFMQVALEMEKDEYNSLRRYAALVDRLPSSSGFNKRVMAEKFADIFPRGRPEADSYDRFVHQNRHSGHTVDLAKAQYENYYGRDRLAPPYSYREPGNYDAFQQARNGASSSGVRPPSKRVQSRIESALKDDDDAGLSLTSSNLLSALERLSRTSP